MKLECGMYFRTKAGTINKIDSFTEDKSEFYFNTKSIFSDGECLGSNWGYTKDIVKFSFDIIDILEVGDYVNGLVVTRICIDKETEKKYLNLYGSISEWENEDIKLIVTHEQMEQMSYEVGE